MLKRIVLSAALASAAFAAPAVAQQGPLQRLAVTPYVGYGFFGDLPDSGPELKSTIAYGGRASYALSPQWAVFGNYQRSTPEVEGSFAGITIDQGEIDVDHWSAGVEFSYVPRGGAEGMLPILLEAGLGQVRYGGDVNDLAANIGVASSLRLSDNLAIRYGANDYISNFRDDEGIVNQIFVQVGAELSF